MLRAVIVDDEQLSVNRLKRILSNSGEIEVCATFLNPLDAYEFVKNNTIDVAFLDISMPDISGLKLSSLLLELDEAIHIVFVTGYNEYALEAFDTSATDYLLKPVTVQRLSATLRKIKKSQRSVTELEPETSLSVYLFNGLKIHQQNQDQPLMRLRSPKTEELFAYLICKRTVTREDIVEALWPNMERDKAMKNLSSTLYYIRRTIQSSGSASYIQTGRNSIRIDESGIYCDLYEYERLLNLIRMAPDHYAELYKRAETLYTGELLKGSTYEWASEYSRHLEQSYIEILESAALFYLEQTQPQQSLHYWSEILKLDPIREDIYYKMIGVWIELGRNHEAHRLYRCLEITLLQELGTKPSHRIEQLMTTLSTKDRLL